MENSSDFYNDIDELKLMLYNAKIVRIDEVVNLLLQIQNNSNYFLNDLISSNSFTQNEVIELITYEINKQLDNQEQSNRTFARSGCLENCYGSYHTAIWRCERNWYIGVAALAISGFFTLGTSTIIGAGAVGGMLLLCQNDAMNDRDGCLGNCN